MELQLGLALPSTKGFDLNMGFGLANDICSNYKRSFEEAFENGKKMPRTLPLLHWNNQPNEEDDPDPKDLENSSSFDSDKYNLSLFAFVVRRLTMF